MTSSSNVSRPAWWPTKEQKQRADKACADAKAATEISAEEKLVLICQGDLGGCGHRWTAPDPGDVFAECPNCHKGTGALV